MSAPTPYALTYDFTSFQASNPTTPLPADKIEIEYNAIAQTTSEIIVNLALIQRSDGALVNGIVTFDSLSTTVQALLGSEISPEGEWLTATAYEVMDLVDEGGSTYICAVDHTSGTFATDLAANKWILWAAGNNVVINNANWSGTDLAVVNGGTGASTATDARTNLGLVIGTHVQAWDADLDAIAALSKTDGNFIVADGSTWTVESGATARASLGLTIGTNVQAYSANLTAFAGTLTAANKIPYATGVGVAGELDFKDEDNMSSNSATAVPSQQSVKAYVDASAAKAWAYVTYSGGTPTLAASYGVASITDLGTGFLRITFTTAFASVNYSVQVTSEDNGAVMVPQVDNRTTTYVDVYNRAFSTGNPADPDAINILCHGAQ